MRKDEVKIGSFYKARVGGRFTTVRLDSLTVQGSYNVTNISTGRKTVFRSAAKFRYEVPATDANKEQFDAKVVELLEACPEEEDEDEQRSDPTVPTPPTDTVQLAVIPSTETASKSYAASSATLPVLASFAAKINTLHQTRTIGSPLAGMTPNAEQEAIIAAALEVFHGSGQRVLVVGAGAGSGKTATNRMLEQVLPGKGQVTAFNKSIIVESKVKFTKCSVDTTHALAYRAIGRLYTHRLGGERVKSYQIARTLGIEAFKVVLPGMGAPDEITGLPTDKIKTLQADFLAGQVITAVRKFCQSADRNIGECHLRYIDGIDATIDGKRGHENNDRVKEYLEPFLVKAWADMVDINGTLPFSHDCYVKIWELGAGGDRPVIAADYILLDESQDTAPVFLSILQQQTHAMLVMVGDDNQQIYEWRGAVNAMASFPDAPRKLLSQSYRFGQVIADVANAILATLDDPTDLIMKGMPTIPSRVDTVASPRCFLYRTNAGAISRVMSCIAEGKKPHLIGGGDDVVKWCEAAIELQAKRPTRHPELCCFESWKEVQEYSKTDEGSDMRLMVKLIDEFGAYEIKEALADMVDEKDADVVVSTAHKSKGREWTTVKLGPDFPTANKMGDSDRRLLYVAATRAQHTLDISECPPFCGGYDGKDTGDEEHDGWVPGLRITYTTAMPSAAALVSYVANGASQCLTAVPIPQGVPSPTVQGNNGNSGAEYTWANMSEGWLVRGPAGKVGQRVTVTRKNNSTSQMTLTSVIRKINDIWFYKV